MSLYYISESTIGLTIIENIARVTCSSFRYPREIANLLTCAMFQCFIVWCCYYNLVTIEPNSNGSVTLHPVTVRMESHIAGYFLYDLLFLLSSERGRKNILFVIHHLISLFIFGVNRYYPCGNDLLNNSVILLLESPSAFINLWKINREINPHSIMTYVTHRISVILYYVMRLVGMTFWLFHYSTTTFQWKWNHYLNGGSFATIFIASIAWFRQLVKKG